MVMEIKKYKTKYHEYIFLFKYDPRVVATCNVIKEEVGWMNFSYYADDKVKGWAFSDRKLVIPAISRYFEVAMTPEVKEKSLEVDSEPSESIEEMNLSSNIKVPLKVELFDFQKEAVDFMDKIKGRALLALPMGGGKTPTAIGYAIYKKYKRVLIMCPASVKENWKREIKKFAGIDASIITDEDPTDWEIINYDQLKKFSTYFEKKEYDLIIVDECFPYETKVLTDKGFLEIGEIVESKLNLFVLSCNLLNNELEWKKIIKHYKHPSKQLIKIRHEKGEIVCTANHKIYTNGGYKEALLLRNGDDLRILQKEIFNSEKREKYGKVLQPQLFSKSKQSNASCPENIKNEKSSSHKEKMRKMWEDLRISKICKKAFLWEILFGKMENVTTIDKEKGLYKRKCGKIKNKNDRNVCKKSRVEEKGIYYDEKEKCRPSFQGEGVKKLFKMEEEKSNIFESWWKWKINKTSNNVSNLNEATNRIFNQYLESQRTLCQPPYLLQSRLSNPRKENCDRSGWKQSQNKKVEIPRQEENCNFESSRVVSVEILERGNFGESSGGSVKNKSIYDIEVEGNHNYFADNILVSNSQKIKNKKAIRTKQAFKVLEKTKDALFLTGTPIMNRPAEIYTTFNYITPTNHWQFCQRYCDATKTRWGWDFSGSSNLDELKEKMWWMYRKTKEEILPELPEKTVNVLEVKMKSRKEYNEAVTDFRQWLVDKKLSLGALYAEALTKASYLKQIIVENKNIEEIIDDFLENGKKLIVFSQYRGVINNLHKHYEKISVEFTGETPVNERQDIIDSFQNNKKIRIFFSTIQAGGVGITLTESDTVLFTDLLWTPADHHQAEDRAHRIGQKNNVNVYYLIDSSTIEKDIWKMLRRKEKMVNQILAGEDKVRKVHIKSLLRNI